MAASLMMVLTVSMMEAIDILDLPVVGESSPETPNIVLHFGERFICGDRVFVVDDSYGGAKCCVGCYFLDAPKCPAVACRGKIFREYNGSN
jgi:hypothetical protein